jgi:hypothetical protein
MGTFCLQRKISLNPAKPRNDAIPIPEGFEQRVIRQKARADIPGIFSFLSDPLK